MAIPFDKFTVKAQEATAGAEQIAGRLSNQQIEPLHLLLALLEQPEGVIPPVLEKVGASPSAVKADVEAASRKLPEVQGGGDRYASSALRRLFDLAVKEIDKLKDEFVSTEHLLLAAASLHGDPVEKILSKHGATHATILKALVAV